MKPKRSLDAETSSKLTPLEGRAWMPFVITTLRLLAILDDELKAAYDLSHLDFGILMLTSLTPSGQRRMSELATTFGVDPSVITYRVRRMESHEWMQRMGHQRDGRLVMAHITDKGRSLLAKARPKHLQSVKRLFLDHIKPQELEVLVQVFGRILAFQNQPAQTTEDGPLEDLIPMVL
ncbi:MAG: MarR family transcriptional regulator [Thermaceae bacterium]|nr:MarR family transcriptional regulator [Thermaceae bacterium]